MPFRRQQIVLGGSAFDPTKIAGCVLWLPANKLSLADGASVATWTDYSGKGNNATQGTGANQPTFKASILNGLPIVRFNGTSHSLATPSMTLSQPWTLAAVFDPLTLFAAGSHDILISASTGTSTSLFCDTTANNNLGLFANANLRAPFVFVAGTFYVVVALINGASSALWVNAVSKVTGNAGANAVSSPLYLGSLFGTSRWCNVDFAEIAGYNRLLSTPEVLTLSRGLGAKYNLAVS